MTGIAVALRQEFMEAKVEKLAGPRYQDVREQKQSRCGQEKGYLVIGLENWHLLSVDPFSGRVRGTARERDLFERDVGGSCVFAIVTDGVEFRGIRWI